MKFSIEMDDLENERGLFAYIEAKLHDAVEPLGTRVKSVKVQLRDVNGPWIGGVDKHCIVTVSLHALGGHIFDEVHSEARFSVELVAARIDGWAKRRAAELNRASA